VVIKDVIEEESLGRHSIISGSLPARSDQHPADLAQARCQSRVRGFA
jgi:hypothetical protein